MKRSKEEKLVDAIHKTGKRGSNQFQQDQIESAASRRIGAITDEQIQAGMREKKINRQQKRMYELMCEGRSQAEIAEEVELEFNITQGIETGTVYRKIDSMIAALNRYYERDGKEKVTKK